MALPEREYSGVLAMAWYSGYLDFMVVEGNI